jgi:hypothetical protein
MSSKRRRHKIILNTSVPSHGYITDPIHEEFADGFCFQVNYSGDAIQSITITLQCSVDYDLVADGSEKWTNLQSTTCTETSGYVIFNVPDVFVPYYRISVSITAGTPYNSLQVFEYMKEST